MMAADLATDDERRALVLEIEASRPKIFARLRAAFDAVAA